MSCSVTAAATGLAALDEFVRRFAHQYLDEAGAIAHDRLVTALASLSPGEAGVVHAFTPDGGSTLTGLSYQTSIEQVLNAVLTDIANGLSADLGTGVAARAAEGCGLPLGGLLAERVAAVAIVPFCGEVAVLVAALSNDRAGAAQ